ncbi:hypothetical protein RMCBS344292_11126 [Rhizopus microsporus]|nr:hypothetical protein RMCBS344292_11126 [Rhizopus microsporus]
MDISPVIPYTTLRRLLRFWYTADFDAPHDISINSPSAIQSQVVLNNMRQEILQFESQLGVPLLPNHEADQDKEQWISDLKRMIDEKLCTDVVLNIFQVNNQQSTQQDLEKTQHAFPAHRFILASQSSYFYSVFCTEFREASTSSVHLPSDLFSPTTLQVVLYYFYTDKLILPPLTSSTHNKQLTRLNEKKHELRILQKVFAAADYLGHYNTICLAVLVRMQTLCHQFKCVCQDCAPLLPFMLLFADKQEKYLADLKSRLITLYSDPLESLAPLWSQKPFAILVQTNKPFVQEIADATSGNITKHNAVRVLHSLHLCLSALRGADPIPTWSQPLLNILHTFLHQTIDMISNHFEYYCVEYPILLSCVDGIGFGFSVDFLEFVLAKVLTDGIHDGNAASLYQGIVRDLGGRQEMVKNVAVDGVLAEARAKCAQYIAKRWMMIKAEGGFQMIEKEILKELADDINVPCRNLTKPMENDFSTIFSFKPKKASTTQPVNVIPAKATAEQQQQQPALKRLSTQTQEIEGNKPSREGGRLRSLSASNTTTPSILRKSQEPDEDTSKTPFQRTKRQGSHSSLTEALLPIDKDVLTTESSAPSAPRQTRLKFALPDTPTRPHRATMQQQKKRTKSPKSRSRWSLGYNTSDSSDDEATATIVPEIGQKVELLRRPLPTLGTIKYIGMVEFSKGTWVGIELESRVGNNDGSVNGTRYFQTFPQRGVFVRLDDFKIISPTSEKK